MLVVTKNYIDGLHYWKDAPDHLDYLRNKHRHVFCIFCYWEVKHNDREIEIIETQKEVDIHFKKYYSNKYSMCDFENMSCEDICNELLERYEGRGLKRITVLEDGQGGAECQV